MAQFFKAKPNSSKQLSAKVLLDVTRLDHLGAGIAQHQGKIIFIPGALPEEKVMVQVTEQKKRHSRAKLLKIESRSPDRIEPKCAHYRECGGCDLQHLALDKQRDHKESVLVGLMAKLSHTKVDTLVPAIIGEQWAYRRRARLATYYHQATKKTTLGFRAQSSKEVIDIAECSVLSISLSRLIFPLSKVLNQLSGRRALGHVELIDVDNGQFIVVRMTKELSEKDSDKLTLFAKEHSVNLIVQGNEGELAVLEGPNELPFYTLDHEIKLSFTPGSFVQVNGEINAAMVEQAVQWLEVKADERVLDLFCGVGNFSLPLAKSGAEVIGVEGVPEMVSQARNNAKQSGLPEVTFFHTDLSADLSKEPWLGKVDKLLLDPARAGAFESLQWLKKMKPKSIVYVSCDPSSLARDSEPLLKHGYKLKKLGLIDMFPQTHHIEAMALFELA
ncbi:23S rRNA (uracil(1939)-C(5))-methyltransferase RlmD [Shewanella sp. D64]|uniref:23S rRNA (uracil(1939)-C(5))-methyltransferase RlmD n=1 Tax=unclassified Shewanella TaxID=196818 RepID=UPI0022BA250A|nr:MULTISPECIES: 23S rRNA (uracil(1939)-C(5))-methyltransferase RlmD [unclassified Shewanella]MEC4728450.1 23S rRNA (uracil(1939)-C(5))-methyltransferase RlmD [Shewanella sp. D64]MEC4740452.1 23S rRNA (uracil(1939)-C(5))-methyltransferase RlmD [Shewanella sp. E94]WBJ94012.1 23S rRNA (uracil(1939)-C(5))-methyltransferase RlmD [Shewanella sp. MTB7]